MLLELGKDFELKFYMKELERHFEASKSPEIGYALGVVYVFSPEPRVEASMRSMSAATLALRASRDSNQLGACSPISRSFRISGGRRSANTWRLNQR